MKLSFELLLFSLLLSVLGPELAEAGSGAPLGKEDLVFCDGRVVTTPVRRKCAKETYTTVGWFCEDLQKACVAEMRRKFRYSEVWGAHLLEFFESANRSHGDPEVDMIIDQSLVPITSAPIGEGGGKVWQLGELTYEPNGLDSTFAAFTRMTNMDPVDSHYEMECREGENPFEYADVAMGVVNLSHRRSPLVYLVEFVADNYFTYCKKIPGIGNPEAN